MPLLLRWRRKCDAIKMWFSWVKMLLPLVVLAVTCVVFGVFALQLPLDRLILPALPAGQAVLVGGVWWAGLATVLILGDARNNYHAAQSWILKEIEQKARKLFWLNPEPKAYWNTGDSIVGDYGIHCDGVFEVRNLRQLEKFVDNLA